MQNFCNGHSETFMRMALRTDRLHTGGAFNGHGEKIGDCGDRIEFYIWIDRERISSIRYRLEGCIHTNASANALIELAEGKAVDEAWQIDPGAVAGYLKTLPADHTHCAELAVGAFYLALADTCRSRSAVASIYRCRTDHR